MTYNQKTGNSKRSMGKDWPNKVTNQARYKKPKRIYQGGKKFKGTDNLSEVFRYLEKYY